MYADTDAMTMSIAVPKNTLERMPAAHPVYVENGMGAWMMWFADAYYY